MFGGAHHLRTARQALSLPDAVRPQRSKAPHPLLSDQRLVPANRIETRFTGLVPKTKSVASTSITSSAPIFVTKAMSRGRQAAMTSAPTP
jgi:hypothetical protein